MKNEKYLSKLWMWKILYINWILGLAIHFLTFTYVLFLKNRNETWFLKFKQSMAQGKENLIQFNLSNIYFL